MKTVYLLIGSNAGDREDYLSFSREKIEQLIGVVVKASSIYETAPWGNTQQSWFLNQALSVDTALSADELLTVCLSVEKEAGRVRSVRFGARTLDIDILYFGEEVINKKSLTVPHPEIAFRRFALTPMAEIAPDFIHPVLEKTQQELIDGCPDPLCVNFFKSNA